MEQLLYLSALFDFYGALLTEKQQECLKMHLFEDFSLSEIGEELGISRQAVHDTLKKAEQSLTEYEKKLGLVRKFVKSSQALEEIEKRIDEITAAVAASGDAAVVSGLKAMKVIIAGLDEE